MKDVKSNASSMINSFSTFSKAIARTNIETKCPYIIDFDEDFNILTRINVGLVFDRIINYSCFLIDFSKNISKSISSAHQILKNNLISDFQIYQIINPILYELIEKAFVNIDCDEEESDNNEKNIDQLNTLKENIFTSVKELIKSFDKIKEIINKISKTESSIEKYTYTIKNEINNNIIKQYQSIIKIIKNYEILESKAYEDLEVSNSEEKILNMKFLLSSLFDDLTIKFHCISIDPFFNETVTDSTVINRIFDTLNDISEKNFKLSYNDPTKVLNEIIEINIEFNKIIDIISYIYEESEIADYGIQKIFGNKYQNLIDISTSVSIINHIINEVEVRSCYYELNKIICSISSSFLNKDSFNDLISTAIQLITTFSQKINILTETDTTKQNLNAAFSSLSYYLEEKCIDRDSSSFGLISTVRIIAQIFSDSEISETLLLNLYKSVSKIIKYFIIKCKKHINQFMILIDDNLEYFENNDLNDSNFYFTALNGIKENEFDINSDHFISMVQQFYDYFCSSYRSFMKITSNCQNNEIKCTFESNTSKFLKLGIRFSNWMNQFYSVVCSIAHLRSKLILDAFSFPIYLLNPSLYNSFNNEDSISNSSDNEYDNEREEEEEYKDQNQNKENKNLMKLLCSDIYNIQKILDKTPQFLLFDINDIDKLFRTIVNISNNFSNFIKFLHNFSDSPFYPIFNSAIVSLSEILSRKFPNCLMSILSLSNFNDSGYFYCTLNASATYSYFILNEFQEIIMKEKIVSPLYISSSYSLILYAINISEYPTNKQNAKKFVPNLSEIYNLFEILWSESIQTSKDEQNQKSIDHSLSDLTSLTNSLKNLIKQIDQVNKPSIPYNIPKPIIELKLYKHTISLIHNKSVKEFGQFLIQTLFQRRNVNKNSQNFLNYWFNNVLNLLIKYNQNQNYKEIERQFNVLENLLKKPNKWSSECYSSYIKHLSEASIFIAYKEEEFSRENIPDLHKKIILLSLKYFTFKLESKNKEIPFNDLFQSNKQFLEMYNYLCQISYVMNKKFYSSKDVSNTLNSSYKNAILIINYVLEQKKIKEMKNHYKLNINLPYIIKSLNELKAKENQHQENESSSISEYINYIINNNQNYNHKYYKLCKNVEENESKNDYSYESKMLFSCISNYNKLFPIQSSLLDTVEKDDAPNEVKKISFQFRCSFLSYLSACKNTLEMNKMKNLEKKKEINDFLCNTYQSINIILAYFVHFIKPIDSHPQKKSIMLIRNFAEVQVLFIKLISFVSKIKPSQTHLFKKSTKQLQKILLVINDTNNTIFQIDKEFEKEIEKEIEKEFEEVDYINSSSLNQKADFVEYEEEEKDSCYDSDDFDKEEENSHKSNSDEKSNQITNLNSSLLSILVEIIFNISRLNELASFSFVSEMYENEPIKSLRNQSIENLKDNFSKLKDAKNQIGTNSINEFDHLYELIESSLKKFINNINNIKFDLHSDYIKHFIQPSSKKIKNKKPKETKFEHDSDPENEGENELEEEDTNELIDSSYSKIFQLFPLFSPQFHIFSSILSIMNELLKENDKIESENKTNAKVSHPVINIRSHFPSPPNLLKSYFLAVDIDPYIGFRSDENNLNLLTSNKNSPHKCQNENIEQNIRENEFENNSLYEKHIRRYKVALKQANNSFDKLNRTLAKFNKVVSDKKSTNGELVIMTQNLKEATDDYAEKILQITYFSKNSKTFQVEQLIELHKYVNSVNELQEAVKERLNKGDEMIHKVNIAVSKYDKILESTADQFRKYNDQYFKKDCIEDKNEEILNAIDQEITVLMKLNESHAEIEQILKDVNMIIDEENVYSNNELNKSIGPIILSISNILKRAKILTRNRIIKAKREELRRNPVIIDKKGTITRRTSINEINITLENEEGLIKSAQKLQEASKFLLVCFETQNSQKTIPGNLNLTPLYSSTSDYRIISSLHSIKTAITDLITQVLYIGGDPDRIMNNEVKELTNILNSITNKIEKNCYDKISRDFAQRKENILKNSNKEDEISKRISPILQTSSFDYEINILRADFETKKQELEKFKRENG